MQDLLSRDRQVVWHPFTPFLPFRAPLAVSHAEGCFLYTDDGRRITDAIASWWVNLHGHAHPVLAEAVADQARRLEHVIFAGFTHEPAVRLAERLIAILPGQHRVFYSDNGSTATEVAMKMALQFFHNLGRPRRRIIAWEGAYHGDTFGAMSVGDRGPFNQPFWAHLFDVVFLPFPDETNEEAVYEQFVREVAHEDVAAFIFEPLVQGAAGMRMYRAELLDLLIAKAQQHGTLCIADEVFTGFGRTGRLFASDHLRHCPDIICLSKGLTGGMMPLGVTTCTDCVAEAFQTEDFMKTFFHGHSFTANPLACAAANASLDLLLDPACQANIRAISDRQAACAARLSGYPALSHPRALGTILAVDVRTADFTGYVNEARGWLYEHFLRQNVLLRPLGNVVYIVPPYCMPLDELDRIHALIAEVGSGQLFSTVQT